MAEKRTFLVVDDNEDNRYLASYALQKAFPGANVVEAHMIDDALRLARELHPDAILTDHHLSVDYGTHFVEKLAANGIRCPVVMVTASLDPSVHRRAYAAGAAHVFAGHDFDFIGYFHDWFAQHGSAATPRH